MLFGSKAIQDKIIHEVRKCEKEQDIKVIYGALVGSISKGLQFVDSDYDTRFLFVKNDFPDNILYPQNLEEKEVIYREYMVDTCFEKIPFWELSAFLQYMVTPSIEGKFSTGLYNVVGWTFLSPYTWDPYGLKNKIVPVIQKLFHKEYFIQYHKDILCKSAMEGEMVNAKEYFNYLYSALAIEWADKYNEFPPIYLQTLLQNVSFEMRCKVIEMVKDAQNKARQYVDSHSFIESSHNASVAVEVNRVPEIDNYINVVRNKIVDFKLVYLDETEILSLEEKIKQVYEVVRYSIFEEESIIERW